MTNQEIQSYERMGIPVLKQRKKNRDFSVFEFLEYIFIFLLSKIYLFGSFSPFGIAFFAVSFPGQRRALGLLTAMLGVFTAGMGLDVLKYLGAFVIVGATSLLLSEEFNRHRWLYALTASVAVLLTGGVYIVFDGFLLYDILHQLLESIVVFLLYFVFDKANGLVRGLAGRKVFEPTESLCLILLSACIILSLKSFPYFEGAAHVLSLTVIFVAGLTGGFPLSCAAGVTMGFVNSVTELLPAQVVAVYAVSSLCAGLFYKKGRMGVIAGFFAANAMAVLYFNSSADTVISFYYVIVAGVLLFLLPDRMLYVFGEVVKAPSYAEASAERLREMMCDKLTATASSFAELSDMFTEIVEERISEDMHDPGALFDRTADSVCRDCSLMHYCWQKEYNNTRRALLSLYDKMELHGAALIKDVPAEFKGACIRLEEFLKALNKSYEIYKINLMWAGRVTESRQLAIGQLKNISSVLEHLKHELMVAPLDAVRLERKVLAALDRNGIAVRNVHITGKEAVQVTLEMDSCGGERLCAGRAAAALGSALGVPMLRVPAPCGEGVCRVTFLEKSRFGIETGFARIAGQNNRLCGDNHILSLSKDGKYMMALSDGMGQGSGAESQSSMTVHLIKRLLCAGFDKETALRLINSMLMVSGEHESFATADLCLVNLYSGALEFIKIGAASSYVKRGATVEKVSCTSLPAGIVREVEADCDLKYTESGDFVVMVTDGITD
ncbi:MAG: SpoIIE family protein phosphatase, partial [Clostridia bacterium]|nr:SpoIIE family protein phosphatase [Clostridia bacterium]